LPGGGRLQVFGADVLPADRLSAAFFFCLGFLASRLDRFCSLFATALSFTLYVSPKYAADRP